MFRWLHMSALRAALLTTRFSRSVVLAAMGAMLPPMPPSDDWRIVSHPVHREPYKPSLPSLLVHERSSIFHGLHERLQTLLQLKISKSLGRTEQLSQKFRNFAGRNNRNNFWCSLIYQNLRFANRRTWSGAKFR